MPNESCYFQQIVMETVDVSLPTDGVFFIKAV